MEGEEEAVMLRERSGAQCNLDSALAASLGGQGSFPSGMMEHLIPSRDLIPLYLTLVFTDVYSPTRDYQEGLFRDFPELPVMETVLLSYADQDHWSQGPSSHHFALFLCDSESEVANFST